MARVCNRGILPILAVAGLILTGCGGGSAKVAAPAPTTTQPGVAPNTPAQRAADKAVAGRAVLKLSDFPLGWTSAPHDKSGSSGPPPAIERRLVACSHLPKRFFDDQADQQPNVDSPDFSKGVVGAGPAARIESSVELDRTVAGHQRAAVIDGLADRGEVLRSLVPRGVRRRACARIPACR